MILATFSGGEKIHRPLLLKTSGGHTHKPFLSKRAGALIKRIKPLYCALEFISSNREEHTRYIKEQMESL
jgi:hypothetical protein